MLIDTHCHIEELPVLERAREAGVQKLINIGCDIETTQKACDFAGAHPEVFFSAGIHPHEASKVAPDYLKRLEEFAANPKCVAIGECGLDYFYQHSDLQSQQRVFESQINLSCDLKKPLVIHVRDAYEDCLDFLRSALLKESACPVVIHCFSGHREHAKAFLDLGCYLSISGIVTFKNADELRAVVLGTPLERLLIETDAPYLAPVPYRGKPNEPAYVFLVAQKIAELKHVSVDQVIDQTGNNAICIFKFDVGAVAQLGER